MDRQVATGGALGEVDRTGREKIQRLVDDGDFQLSLRASVLCSACRLLMQSRRTEDVAASRMGEIGPVVRCWMKANLTRRCY